MRVNVPEYHVGACSPHSFRIGFACALLVASCLCDWAQALVRWGGEWERVN